jgi:hypothetical protein
MSEQMKDQILKIAEIFEKKNINRDKYGLIVLCDFIYEKAKRLYIKYEN